MKTWKLLCVLGSSYYTHNTNLHVWLNTQNTKASRAKQWQTSHKNMTAHILKPDLCSQWFIKIGLINRYERVVSQNFLITFYFTTAKFKPWSCWLLERIQFSYDREHTRFQLRHVSCNPLLQQPHTLNWILFQVFLFFLPEILRCSQDDAMGAKVKFWCHCYIQINDDGMC